MAKALTSGSITFFKKIEEEKGDTVWHSVLYKNMNFCGEGSNFESQLLHLLAM